MKRTLATVAIASIVIVGVAGCAKQEPPTPRFKTAVSKCDLKGKDGVEYADKGVSLILSTAGEDDLSSDQANILNVMCVLKRVKASAALQDRMLSTRAMDGMQEGDFRGIHASWTYHPDNGFNLSLEDERLAKLLEG
ncbi:hypothetical protein JG550_000855 [Curtobacterium flaccumfaciens pv. flaccumfaciens]|uniref:hypothetical protein n=1 Tax=Curtobacterium flaccumfaciens TaxID=2035 RepID=UPI001ADD403C|nr:hypothetical protein [Curtobacterium flaccumfaciens]MBO9046722.1 hypothetical protein [Curtobacterium flaccumfaciens pv. flaccumfaciens]QTR91596.1 hypothetical protein JG550_000855 [Curtobacterium flaccumfaciens pv. flaccumfaciens]